MALGAWAKGIVAPPCTPAPGYKHYHRLAAGGRECAQGSSSAHCPVLHPFSYSVLGPPQTCALKKKKN